MISSSFLFNNPYETQIQQIMQIEARKRTQLQIEQNDLESQKTAISSIDSKLSSLNNVLTSMIETPDDNFNPLSGTSTDPSVIEFISASGLNNPGDYSIKVTQLAKEDVMLSDAIVQDSNNYNSNGVGSFDLAIGADTSVSVNVDTTGLNNQQVLEAIATAVNDQVGDKVTASVFKLGDGSSRLSFKSVETGEANRLTISNQQGDFAALNLTNEYTTDQLNAKFTIDQVSFERSSNLINDAVQGLTFELNKETGTQFEQIKVSRDTSEARKSIEKFILKFNDANSTIRNKTYLDADTGARGILQNERSVRNISFNLRLAASLPVDSLAGTGINSLASIGIDIAKDGKMSIDDSEKLTEALKTNPQGIADLFSSENGIASALQQQINQYISDDTGGVFENIQDGIDRRIDRLDDRIKAENEYLTDKQEELRAEFAELDQIIADGQRQFDAVMTFRNRLGLY